MHSFVKNGFSKPWRQLFFLTLSIWILGLCQSTRANVWIDETFDDGAAFDASALDPYDHSPPPDPPLSLARQEGSLTITLAYNGTSAYRLDAGEGLGVAADTYARPTNGAYQYFQFALCLDAFPQAGQMAEFRWDWILGAEDYSFFLRLVSTGTSVNLVAGEDLVYSTSEIISAIDQVNDWQHITLQMQKNAEPATDSRTGQTLSQGLRIYINSENPAVEILLPGNGAEGDKALDWEWDVTAGALYLDDFYWEGGMTNGDESSSSLRPFTKACPCPCIPADYPVQLDFVQIDPVYADMLLAQATGWLGSDVAHSIPLSATRNLWLFADTFIGNIENGSRAGGAAFINSSIGLQDTTTAPPGSVEFFWGPSNTSLFPHQAGTGGDFYWPTNGIVLEGELFIFCYNVASGGPFGFSLPGTTLIRVPNPNDPPGEWIQQATDLGIGDNNQGFHTAVYKELPYIYLMGYDDTGGTRRSVLARILASDLIAGQTSAAYQFWSDIGGVPQWSNTPDNLVTLFEPGVTESDIQYDSALGLYFCTTYTAFGPEIYITTAPELTGPWSEPVCIYEVPEHDAVSFDISSYAVRPHPELSTGPGEVVITYATNSVGSLAPLFTTEGLGIYHPRFVRAQFQIPSHVGFWLTY